MRSEKRILKDGSVYFSFVFYNSETKTRLRLSREEIKLRFGKDITTEEEAKECLKLLEAQYTGEKVKIQRRLAWEKEYYNFVGLIEQYAIYQKKRSPNSWDNNIFFFKNYVLPFFLTKNKLNNLELWPQYFDKFRDWLETEAKQLRKATSLLSFASKNHAINALNTFLKMAFKNNLIHKEARCEPFGAHLMNKRTLDDVIYPEEVEKIYLTLKSNDHLIEAVFFRYLFFSGMRFSEGRGVSLADLFQGPLPQNQFLGKKLTNLNITYFGYIAADAQLNDRGERVPFKGKREISESYVRLIPIIDKILWNDLVSLAQVQYKKWEAQPSISKKAFNLFEGLDDSTATVRLKEAFQSNRLKYRTWHCLRHSRATWLIGETGDEILARTWLGQSSAKTFARYNHLYQALIREAQIVKKTEEFGLKKID